MPETLRVVRCGALPPDLNMALDEALLEGDAPPTLRLYGWSPAAVSLGRFQDAAAFAGCGLPVVRRITGGGAIHHDREITFALIADAHWLPGAVADSYELVHGAFARALRAVGIPTGRPAASFAGCARPAQAWCFAQPACFDLVTPAGGKLLGSAQRRVRRPRPRVLHHGSLPLERPALTPGCGAIADLRDPGGLEAELTARIAAELAGALGLVAGDGALTDAERERAHALQPRYPDLRRVDATGSAFRRPRQATEVQRGLHDHACSPSATNSKISSTAPSRSRRSRPC
jgi:hypothetical protein